MDLKNEKTEHEEEVLRRNRGPMVGVRHIQSVLLFLLLTSAYSMRVCLSVSIVAMLDQKSSNDDIPTYDWTNKDVILSSFFWGYVVLQVFAGEIGKRYGPKWLLVGAMAINSASCVLIPLIADNLGSYGVMACRVIQGLSQGFFFPNVHNLMGKWIPANERSTLGSFVYSGPSFGTIVALPITGIISGSWSGWPLSFYVFGGTGLVWCVVWSIWGANSPKDYKNITDDEKDYIEISLDSTKIVTPPKTPWKELFTSLPVWAIIVANFGQNWGYSTLLTEIPNYLSAVMGFDIEGSGWLSAAPYLALFILTFCFGPIADFLTVRGYWTRTTVRKVFNSIGIVGPAIALTCLGFVPDDQKTLSVILLIAAVGTNAAVLCGFQVNHVDLSPKYSGTLMGITNGSSNSFSIISPLVVQAVVGSDDTNKSKWRIIFLTASGMYVASAIFYAMFASGERQWWDSIADEKDEESDPKKSEANNNDTKKY